MYRNSAPVWCAEARIDKDYIEAENIAEHIEITFNIKLGLSPKFLVTIHQSQGQKYRFYEYSLGFWNSISPASCVQHKYKHYS